MSAAFHFRGISQLGIIKAMEEHGIPIDIVGGVSIGALNTALYAEDVDSALMEKRLAAFCKDFGSLWKKVIDLTYPATAMFTGTDSLTCYDFTKLINFISFLWMFICQIKKDEFIPISSVVHNCVNIIQFNQHFACIYIILQILLEEV